MAHGKEGLQVTPYQDRKTSTRHSKIPSGAAATLTHIELFSLPGPTGSHPIRNKHETGSPATPSMLQG